MVAKVRPFQVNRRTLCVIAALAVAVVVALAGIAYYLDAHRYPSEHTPLVLHPWGISWVNDQRGPDSWDPRTPFENISLAWTDSSFSAVGSPALDLRFARANTSEFSLPSNLTELYDTYGSTLGWDSGGIVNGVHIISLYGILITDNNGNGLFDYGDAISLFHGDYVNGTLVHAGFQNDTAYGIGLNAPGSSPLGLEFKYAIHHGRLFAWGSD